jgi:leader peptidase (prepilin peptidase)/N-methyltransferase
MGLGDVHLMAAAGAVLGCLAPILAFFIAPFYGLLAALLTAVRHRQGELPYGPWLSLGLLTIMLFQDKIWAYLSPGLEVAWQLLTGG